VTKTYFTALYFNTGDTHNGVLQPWSNVGKADLPAAITQQQAITPVVND